jgi:hypothetical protein
VICEVGEDALGEQVCVQVSWANNYDGECWVG